MKGRMKKLKGMNSKQDEAAVKIEIRFKLLLEGDVEAPGLQKWNMSN